SDPHRIVRDALHLLDPGRLDLLYAQCRGCVRATAQAAGRAPALSDVGLPLHALALRGSFPLVYGRRAGHADAPLGNGADRRRHRSRGVQDVAPIEAGDSCYSPPMYFFGTRSAMLPATVTTLYCPTAPMSWCAAHGSN